MRRILLAVALVLSFVGSLSAQTVIDSPPANSTTLSLNPWIGGWSIDPSGSGVGVDAVQLWLFPQPYGDPEFLGGATLGDDRPDIAAAFGSRFEYAGWHIFPSVPMHAGAAVICAYGRNNVSSAYASYGCNAVTIYEADPNYPDATIAASSNVTSAHFDVATNTLAVSGWAARDAASVGAGPGVRLLIDDYPGYGSVWASSTSSSACSYLAYSDCRAVATTSTTDTGVAATYALEFSLPSGWHYTRWWVVTAAEHVPYSNAWWFYVP